MIFYDNGSGYTVGFNQQDCDKFNRNWPASLVSGKGSFSFDKSGDLIDTTGAAADADEGGGWLEFSAECQEWGRRRVIDRAGKGKAGAAAEPVQPPAAEPPAQPQTLTTTAYVHAPRRPRLQAVAQTLRGRGLLRQAGLVEATVLRGDAVRPVQRVRASGWADMVAKWLWASSWADWVENLNSGEKSSWAPDDEPEVTDLPRMQGEISNLMPEVPSALLPIAQQFVQHMEKLNGGKSMDDLYAAAQEAADAPGNHDSLRDEDEFAFLCVMSCMGAGVNLHDIGAEKVIKKDYCLESFSFYADVRRLVDPDDIVDDAVPYDSLDFGKVQADDFMGAEF